MATFFVHIGDVHLQAGHPRNADRLASLDQIIDANVARPRLGAWLIPGDLFHTRSTAQDRNDLAERLTRMAAVAPVVMVRGNHDQPGDLDIFERLKTGWPIYVITRPGVYEIRTATAEMAAIAAVPYPDKFGLVAAGVAPGDVSQTAVQLLDVIFMQLGADLQAAVARGCVPLFMGHFNTRGAVVSTGQPQIGHEQEIDRLSLERLPAVYCALNHIHEPQEVGKGVYAGSIAAMDYGEISPRSFVLVEAEHRDDGLWTASWSREAIATPPMFHIEGELVREGFRPDHDEWMCLHCSGTGDGPYCEGEGTLPCAFCDGTGRHDWIGCDVRVRYRYLASERAVLNDAAIREMFAGALRLKIEGVAIPDRELRAPAVAAAKTLHDKLAAFRKVEQLEPSVVDKLSMLQQLDAVALAHAVASRVQEIERPAVQETTVAA